MIYQPWFLDDTATKIIRILQTNKHEEHKQLAHHTKPDIITEAKKNIQGTEYTKLHRYSHRPSLKDYSVLTYIGHNETITNIKRYIC